MYTHLGQGINVLRDPPKSPLKKGDFESGFPFFKRGGGGSNPVEARSEDLCVHGSPYTGITEGLGTAKPLHRNYSQALTQELHLIKFSFLKSCVNARFCLQMAREN